MKLRDMSLEQFRERWNQVQVELGEHGRDLVNAKYASTLSRGWATLFRRVKQEEREHEKKSR